MGMGMLKVSCSPSWHQTWYGAEADLKSYCPSLPLKGCDYRHVPPKPAWQNVSDVGTGEKAAVKRACCSCRETGLHSQHLHTCSSSFREVWFLLASAGTRYACGTMTLRQGKYKNKSKHVLKFLKKNVPNWVSQRHLHLNNYVLSQFIAHVWYTD